MAFKRPAIATLVLALIGLAIGLELSHTHWQLTQKIAPACNVSSAINCEVVLSSDYAYLFGIPIAWTAVAAYAGFALAALVAWQTGSAQRRRQLASGLFIAAVAALGFSLYLALVSVFVLGAICPFCTGLYVVNLALLVATARLASATQAVTRDQQTWQARARLAGVGAVAALVLLAGTLAWKVSASAYDLTPAQVCERDPSFCEKYRAMPVTDGDLSGGHVKGSSDPKVTIVEFSDFECGHCLKAYESLKEVLPRYSKDVQVRFRHFPLDSACNPTIPPGAGHRYACLAAVAAECAGQQQKFWEYHDQLFEHQPVFDRDSLFAYAERVGLDRAQFTACLESDAARAAVQRDIAAGTQLKIESTPTLYFNGRTFRGAPTAQMLSYAIQLERPS
ncbi:MAG: vitamin K epoxide reductase family protein [Deltaproteobacteria bacterium]|nr:vitamin K epoxide reductase family protein [Deltaproteobacteria bacterium]